MAFLKLLAYCIFGVSLGMSGIDMLTWNYLFILLSVISIDLTTSLIRLEQ